METTTDTRKGSSLSKYVVGFSSPPRTAGNVEQAVDGLLLGNLSDTEGSNTEIPDYDLRSNYRSLLMYDTNDFITDQGKEPVYAELRRKLLANESLNAGEEAYLLDDARVLRVRINDRASGVHAAVVLNGARLVAAALNAFHDDAAHPGWLATYETMRLRYWWPNMRTQVRNWVTACTDCARRTTTSEHLAGAHPLPLPALPWMHMAMDAAGPFTDSGGMTYVMVFVDVLISYVVYEPMKDKSALEVRRAFREGWAKYFGNPVMVLHDQAKELIGDVMKQEFRSRGTTAIPVHAHASNGAAETQINQLKRGLAIVVQDHTDWAQRLPMLQLAKNTRQDKYGCSPMSLALGITPRFGAAPDPVDGGPAHPALIQQKMATLQDALLEHSRQRREQRREYVRASVEARNAQPFLPGQLVMVRLLQDITASSKKLAHQSEGPFTVMGPGPHHNTVRIQMNRGDFVNGNIVHVEHVKHLETNASRYFYDPTPNSATRFAEAENGAWPGDLGLLPGELAELAVELQGSQPLVPTKYPQSDYCYICRKQQLLKAGAGARVQCSFCNGFAHTSCLYTAGSERAAAQRPTIFRCSGCVRDLTTAFDFVRRKAETRSAAVERQRILLDELMDITQRS